MIALHHLEDAHMMLKFTIDEHGRTKRMPTRRRIDEIIRHLQAVKDRLPMDIDK